MQMETGLLVVPTASLDSNVQINPPRPYLLGKQSRLGWCFGEGGQIRPACEPNRKITSKLIQTIN